MDSRIGNTYRQTMPTSPGTPGKLVCRMALSVVAGCLTVCFLAAMWVCKDIVKAGNPELMRALADVIRAFRREKR